MTSSRWRFCVLLLSACEARAITVVDCASNDDCAEGAECTTEHVCSDPSSEPRSSATALVWDDSGVIVAGRNAFGVSGGWWRYRDCESAQDAVANGSFVCPANPPTPQCCTAWDDSLFGPDGEPGWTVTGGIDSESSVCVKGTASQVLNDVNGEPAYGILWGSHLSLTLNAGMRYDARRAFPGGPITGLSFELEGSPARGLRIGVVMDGTYEVFYRELFAFPPVVRMRFDELAQGVWVTEPQPLDLAKLLWLDFQFTLAVEEPTPFEVCVRNLRVMQ